MFLMYTQNKSVLFSSNNCIWFWYFYIKRRNVCTCMVKHSPKAKEGEKKEKKREKAFVKQQQKCATWWRHQMETFSALLAICVGNSPVTRSFEVSLSCALNKWFSKQSRGWWFETPTPSSWRHCNEERHIINVIKINVAPGLHNDSQFIVGVKIKLAIFNLITGNETYRKWWNQTSGCVPVALPIAPWDKTYLDKL